MSTIRNELINATLDRAYALVDYDVHDDIHKRHEFCLKTIHANKYLTKNEKTETIKLLNKTYDQNKLIGNSGTKRICENCQLEFLATLYCEQCVRIYLKSNFSNWTSGNDDIGDLIQKCQMKTLAPYLIAEWIPYNNLQNIKYLTKGGCSEIYTAVWNDGKYDKWDPKEKQLKRIGSHKVILKRLENVENANQSWLKEVCNLKK